MGSVTVDGTLGGKWPLDGGYVRVECSSMLVGSVFMACFYELFEEEDVGVE